MNTQIYEEASEWLVEFRTEEPDVGQRSEFQAWLAKSPEHVRAYLEVSGVWEVTSSLPSGAPADVQALIERARTAPNVVAMDVPHEAGRHAAPGERSRRTGVRQWAVAAALLICLIAPGVYLYVQRNTYVTSVGEQRSILLPDGSTIDMNARSRVRVRMQDRVRLVELLEGQALFRVAKDRARPFIVTANGTQVRAVGTQFDVNQRKRGLIVTVVEGTVAVSGQTANNVPLVTAGEQITVVARVHDTPPLKVVPHPADTDSATAWTRRRLIFDSTPLQDVAEEFNRNNARPLIIDGDDLDDFHVSGAFSSADPEPLLKFLRTQPGIRVIGYPDRIVVSRSR